MDGVPAVRDGTGPRKIIDLRELAASTEHEKNIVWGLFDDSREAELKQAETDISQFWLSIQKPENADGDSG